MLGFVRKKSSKIMSFKTGLILGAVECRVVKTCSEKIMDHFE